MAGLLRHLIQRLSAPEGVLRPRLVSPFEISHREPLSEGLGERTFAGTGGSSGEAVAPWDQAVRDRRPERGGPDPDVSTIDGQDERPLAAARASGDVGGSRGLAASHLTDGPFVRPNSHPLVGPNTRPFATLDAPTVERGALPVPDEPFNDSRPEERSRLTAPDNAVERSVHVMDAVAPLSESQRMGTEVSVRLAALQRAVDALGLNATPWQAAPDRVGSDLTAGNSLSGSTALTAPIAPLDDRYESTSSATERAVFETNPTHTRRRPMPERESQEAAFERLDVRPLLPIGPPAAALERAGAAAKGEPTIVVSIGRIDIRASATTVVPKKAAPKRRPELSLESYLEQRRGGRA